MATKKTKQLNEFQASYGDADLTQAGSVPEPVNTGDPHANRIADRPTPDTGMASTMSPGQEQNLQAVLAQSRSVMVAQIVDKIAAMKGDELTALYGQMYGPNENPADLVSPSAAQNNLASVTTHEDFDEVFAGETISEEAKTKIKTLFESSVSVQVHVIEAELQDEYQAKLEEGISEAIDTMVEHVDNYASKAAETYLTENKLALVDTARVQIAESFMLRMKSLLSESFFDLETDGNAVVALTNELEATKGVALAEMTKVKSLEEQLATVQKNLVIESASYGLTVSQRETLKTLSETVKYTNADEYKTKVEVLLEQKVRTTPASSAATPAPAELLITEELPAIETKADTLVSKIALNLR